eukprot:scaffold1900_cov389-Prasinococcus_capsulatus_cf.AAC.2
MAEHICNLTANMEQRLTGEGTVAPNVRKTQNSNLEADAQHTSAHSALEAEATKVGNQLLATTHHLEVSSCKRACGHAHFQVDSAIKLDGAAGGPHLCGRALFNYVKSRIHPSSKRAPTYHKD